MPDVAVVGVRAKAVAFGQRLAASGRWHQRINAKPVDAIARSTDEMLFNVGVGKPAEVDQVQVFRAIASHLAEGRVHRQRVSLGMVA